MKHTVLNKIFIAIVFGGPLALAANYSPEEMSAARASQWVQHGFYDPKAYTIEVDPTSQDYTHSIDLSVVVLKNAGWNNLQLVADHFQRVSDIYAQCKIKIGEIKVVFADAGTNTLTESETESYAARIPAYMKRPTLIFATKVSDQHDAYAWSGEAGCSNRPAACNTAWISSIVNTNYYKGLRSPSYSVVAHELAHILGDYDHTQINGNILAEFKKSGADITAEQCRKFKTFSEMDEL